MGYGAAPESEHQHPARPLDSLRKGRECHGVPDVTCEGVRWVVVGMQNPVTIEPAGLPRTAHF